MLSVAMQSSDVELKVSDRVEICGWRPGERYLSWKRKDSPGISPKEGKADKSSMPVLVLYAQFSTQDLTLYSLTCFEIKRWQHVSWERFTLN